MHTTVRKFLNHIYKILPSGKLPRNYQLWTPKIDHFKNKGKKLNK